MKICKLITWFKLCEMTWSNLFSAFIETQNYLNYFWNIFG
jgi:hypothetical protein